MKEAIQMVDKSDKLSHKEKISFGLGDLASNFVWGMVGSYLLFFYTDIFGLTAASAGTLFLVARVWDAVNDPIMGVIVDKTKSKHGKARPYILYLAIPFGILSVVTFITPDFSYTGKVIYAYVTYISLGMMYTAINLPYGAMLPMMTRDSGEKAQLGSYRTMGLGIGSTLVGVLTLPLVNFFGNGNQEMGFPIVMGIYSLVGVLLFLTVFKNCKERYSGYSQTNKDEKATKSIVKMFKNKPWLMVAIFALIQFLKIGVVSTVMVYYANYVLGKPETSPYLVGAVNAGNFFGGLLALRYLKQLGNRNGSIIALIISASLFLLMFPFESNWLLTTLFVLLSFTFSGVSGAGIFAMLADTLDFHEWKYKTRPEGLLYSAYSFATKFGIAIGSAFVGYALGWAGYDPDAITNTAQNTIRWLVYGGGILITLAQIIPLIFYNLDKYHYKLVNELIERS